MQPKHMTKLVLASSLLLAGCSKTPPNAIVGELLVVRESTSIAQDSPNGSLVDNSAHTIAAGPASELTKIETEPRLTTTPPSTSPLLTDWNGTIETLPTLDEIKQHWWSLLQAAEAGSEEAQYRLGFLMVATEEKVESGFDRTTGLRWLQTAAEQGHKTASLELGGIYFNGTFANVDLDKAREIYKFGADKGDARCQLGVGFIALTHEDYSTAKRYIKLAADQGLTEAQTLLGKLYVLGNSDIGIHYAEARKYFEKAAVQEDSEAQCYLGEFYQSGLGGPIDIKMAYWWYGKAALGGHVIGQYNMGVLHFELGDMMEAKKWFKLAAKQNHAAAYSNLSVISFSESDYYAAEEYIDKAIALGSPDGYARKFAIQRQRDLEERIRAPGLQYGIGY